MLVWYCPWSGRRMLIDLTRSQAISANEVGGKAYNLHRLRMLDLPVPPALVIPAQARRQSEAASALPDDNVISEIMAHHVISTGDLFAVRSSGIGEDALASSFAGAFDSYLYVSQNNIPEAVMRVWESLSSDRAKTYAEAMAVSVSSMAVIIQHMIKAEYAGVTFTVSPLETDNRIALFEIVQGDGIAVVSGAKTPFAIRVNKLTGMRRIIRNGDDQIEEYILDKHIALIMPLIQRIEAQYGVPMDIEWVIAQGRPYIVQARPITARTGEA